MARHIDLTAFDPIPEAMQNYLRYNGPHFSLKLSEYASSLMVRDGKAITPYTKEAVENLLKTHNVKLENNVLYDHVYVANMGLADFLASSVPTEKHLALYIKNVIDDEDGYEGMPFNRWYADMCKKGIPIDWNEYL